MIPSGAIGWLWGLPGGLAWAQTPSDSETPEVPVAEETSSDAEAEGEPTGDSESPSPVPFAPREGEEEVDALEVYREPFSVLADRAIGTTSVPVEFDWRRSRVQVGAWGSFVSELNNFNTLRGGLIGRFPTRHLLWEVGVSYVAVGETQASRELALTPYRQAGRPSRGELDIGVAVPLAEGVVTSQPRWFPAVQMVLNGYVDVRYRVVPAGFRGMSLGQAARAVVSPQLTPEERVQLEELRLPAMTVDPERLGVLLGVGNDFYFKPGIFLSPRVMFSVPILAPVTETQLLWWSDAQLAIGAVF